MPNTSIYVLFNWDQWICALLGPWRQFKAWSLVQRELPLDFADLMSSNSKVYGILDRGQGQEGSTHIWGKAALWQENKCTTRLARADASLKLRKTLKGFPVNWSNVLRGRAGCGRHYWAAWTRNSQIQWGQLHARIYGQVCLSMCAAAMWQICSTSKGCWFEAWNGQ